MKQKTKNHTVTGITGNSVMQKLFLNLFCLLSLSLFCRAQVPEIDLHKEIKGLFQVHIHKAPRYSPLSEKPKNEIEFLMASGFNIYKTFFSSQDNPSCVFHPSCSEFSVMVLQEKGLLVGTLYTFDRLSRCHLFIKPDHYFFDPLKQRFYDPVR